VAIRFVDRRSRGGRSGPSRRVERRVYVKAAPRHVWAALHDADTADGLFPELALGPADPSWPAAGASRLGVLRLGLLRTNVRLESLEARPDTAFRLIVTSDEFTLEWGWRLEPLAGGTRVVHDGAFEAYDRWASLLVRLGRDSAGALADAHLRALKLAAEQAWSEARGPAA
jgi:hypothetical protein